VIIVDRALEERAASGRPVQVAMIGAGAMGRGIARQMFRAFPGLRLAVVANRTLANARRAYEEAGVADVELVGSVAALEQAIAAGAYAVTDDPLMACEAPSIEVVVEVTGTVEQAAHTVSAAIGFGKHVVLMNAELDGTVGPLLKTQADSAGVILSACDGDQPGVEANLYRFVKGIGLRPLVCGNIKGLQDPYRNPTTQEGYARTWGLGVAMVTSFADGTKVSYEQAIVANGTGMRAPKRGLYAWEHTGHVDELTTRYDIDELERIGGVVDYVIGAQPAPGVFVMATHDDPLERHYMALYKRGDGPLYSFYTPQHLCHFEVPTSVARVALLNDAVLAPLGAPIVEVVATAKIDLAAGETIDGIGGYMTYGQCDDAEVTRSERLLPMGVAEGCRLTRAVARDQVLTYDDVELPPDRLIDRLRAEQEARFFS
jgi:predicted homoserine dehydrogenase-like protein